MFRSGWAAIPVSMTAASTVHSRAVGALDRELLVELDAVEAGRRLAEGGHPQVPLDLGDAAYGATDQRLVDLDPSAVVPMGAGVVRLLAAIKGVIASG
jgi:hypothetical protein